MVRYLSIAMLICSALALLAHSAVTADECEAGREAVCAAAQAARAVRCGDGPDGVCGYEASAAVDGAALPALTETDLAFVSIAAGPAGE